MGGSSPHRQRWGWSTLRRRRPSRRSVLARGTMWTSGRQGRSPRFRDIFRNVSVEDRLSYLRKIIGGFRARLPELARTMTLEMGAPITFATQRQATVALFHFEEAARVLAQFQFEEPMGSGIIRREPIGVCGLITPWNWPLNQVALQSRTGARDRPHRRAETQRDRAALLDAVCRDRPRCRRFRRAPLTS